MRNVLILGNVFILENVIVLRKCHYFGKWRISHVRYCLYNIDSSIRIGLFIIFSIFILTWAKQGVLILENVLILGTLIMSGDSNINVTIILIYKISKILPL